MTTCGPDGSADLDHDRNEQPSDDELIAELRKATETFKGGSKWATVSRKSHGGSGPDRRADARRINAVAGEEDRCVASPREIRRRIRVGSQYLADHARHGNGGRVEDAPRATTRDLPAAPMPNGCRA